MKKKEEFKNYINRENFILTNITTIFDKNGNIKKVTFGDPNLRVRGRSAARRKSFAARHKCAEEKDKTSANWWACDLPKYAKQLGLSEPAYRYW